MELTRELLAQRKAYLQEQFDAIKKQVEQLKDTGNAFYGAMQDCDYWLAELAKEATPQETP